MQLYEKYQPELKYYSLEQIEKFLPQILYCLMDTRISSLFFPFLPLTFTYSSLLSLVNLMNIV